MNCRVAKMAKTHSPRGRKGTTFFLAKGQQHGAEPSPTSPGTSLQVLSRTSKRAEDTSNNQHTFAVGLVSELDANFSLLRSAWPLTCTQASASLHRQSGNQAGQPGIPPPRHKHQFMEWSLLLCGEFRPQHDRASVAVPLPCYKTSSLQ